MILKTQFRTGDRSRSRAQPNRRRMARLGGESVPGNSMPTAWMPYEPSKGHRFNSNRLLLDPCASAISRLPPWDFVSARGYDSSAPEQDSPFSKLDNSRSMPKCVFVDEPFEWGGDQPPRHPWSKTVIYETHVRGFTIHPKAGVEHPGNLPRLDREDLAISGPWEWTAVELMPVQGSMKVLSRRGIRKPMEPLRNYWGYDPVGLPRAHRASPTAAATRSGPAEARVQGNGPRHSHKAGIE